MVAGPWGVPAQLTALVCAVGFGGVLERLQRTRRLDPDAAIGLLLVAALAIGVVLASDVYHSGAGVDRLLFGSLIALEPSDIWLTAAAAVGALAADAALRRSWLASGFDPDGARAGGVGVAAADRALLLAVAIAVVVALDAVGALLVTVVLTVPAATVRLFEPPLRIQQLATFALTAVEGSARSGSPTASTSAPARRWPCSARWSTASPPSWRRAGWRWPHERRHARAARRVRARGRRARRRRVRGRPGGDRGRGGAAGRREDDAVPRAARQAAVQDRLGRARGAPRRTCRRPRGRGWTSRSAPTTSR